MENLVERDEEEKALAQIYSECSAGRCQMVAIGGPLAQGKTALLDSFARDADTAGATVLKATASSFERYQPLGVIDQLLRGYRPHLSGADLEVRALVESVGQAGAHRHQEISPPILALLHGAFQYLTDSSPLVVCIDDAHFMDVESLQYLLALMRRMGGAPLTVALAYCPGMGRDTVQRILQAEVLRMPNCTQLDLEPLSVTGVAAVLEEYCDLETAGRVAADTAALCGGRPLLVHALAEDCAARAAGPDTPQPAAGGAFGRAVLSCLYRAEPVVLQIAQAIAALGEFRSASAVARLCGMDLGSVECVVASPGVGGLLDHDLLGQPCIREVVLGSLPPKERHELRGRAARLLYQEGAPALVTAEHLMRIDDAVPWARQVLCDAAEQALAAGGHEQAIGYLERAHRECVDARERIDTAARLTDLLWRYDPAAVKSYLPELVAAAEEGELSVRQAVPVVRSLLWNGQVEQATRVMARFGDGTCPSAGKDALPYAELIRRWLPLTYPGIAPTATGGEKARPTARPAGTAEHRAAAAFGAVLRSAGEEGAVPAAELVLREALAGAVSPASSLAALMVLIYSDNLDKASVWCDALRASLRGTYGLVWNALFTSARAEIHYRLGDLANANRQARAALTLMPRESWGAAIVIPLSQLILTTTAMGNLAEAESYLDIPVPSAAFGTLGGVVYLDARGNFHLARGRYDAALQDFLAAGHLMKLWEADCPSAVPWRTNAARAYLHMGRVAQARELLTERMSLFPLGHARARSLTYRTVAATLRPDERPPVLLKAANILDRCGDSLNLAYTLADLGRAYESMGQSVQACRHAHKARALVERCAAAPLPEPPAAAAAAAAAREKTEPRPADGSGPAARRLSSAEWRVAALAARGSTNEQIARKLFITVSTVEQHLTRAYRKLGIRRRTQLPTSLAQLVP
ncbi:AAA family ATPase [Streptomyces sp. NPDC021020]|uniref:helix-turn-helix transcriptional regulator n=1 Tax=Streptomyces sp. NPDC021020 TaxID=3365109 RepID=UPI0037B6C8A2